MPEETSNPSDSATRAQSNISIVRAWIDAHNRHDPKALDCMDDSIEVVEAPTGAVHKGLDAVKKLTEDAYARGGWKDITNLFASEDQACVEYVARITMPVPPNGLEKGGGSLGPKRPDSSSAGKAETKVCAVFHFKNGKIVMTSSLNSTVRSMPLPPPEA